MATPLSNIRVLELGRTFAAPWAGEMLADLGAEVIKVEAIDGDPMRQMGQGVIRDAKGRDTGERSVFATVNRNKKSITVDLANAGGQGLVRRLAATCDVLIENYKVGDLARRGLDYVAIRAINPAIVYLSLTGFGQTGPYAHRPGMDNIVQGMSGFMSCNGMEGEPPQAASVAIMDTMAGAYAAIGILAALHARDVQGAGGQHIDLALLDTAVSVMRLKLVATMLTGVEPPRAGRTRGYIPGGLFQTADGWIQLTVGTDTEFGNFCEAIDRRDLLHDPRYADRWLRTDNQVPLLDEVKVVLRGGTTSHWVSLLAERGVMAGAVLSVAEVSDDPQVRARDDIVEIDHAAGSRIPVVRNPLRLSGTQLENPRTPPLLGEHTDEILADLLGMDEVEIADLRRSGAIGSRRGGAAAG
jgi:crotonobetainyl-CoA:carnitine CoA-transferase CaiB-like acyl-CoA transferase